MSTQRHPAARVPTVTQSLSEYGRGLAGGLVFSLPLLYTMEVWWSGFIAQPERLLVYVIASFLLLLGYNRYAGLREDASWTEVAIDSVEEMGIGLLIAAVFMFLIGRISPDMHLSEIVGKIVMEGMTVAIGVSVGTAQLGGSGDDSDSGMNGNARKQDPDELPPDIHSIDQLVIALCAAVLFGANVAATEEILVVANEISSWNVIGLMIASILTGVVILFYSEFPGASALPDDRRYRAIATRAVATYSVALLASAAMLWFFGRLDGVPLMHGFSQVVVLGVATTLGASAGRLLLQR